MGISAATVKQFLGTKVGVAVVAGIVGTGVGAAATATPDTGPPPEPKTITKTKTETVRVTVPGPEREVTPQSCIQAIAAAREGFGLASEFAYIMVDTMNDISEFDFDSISLYVAKLETVNEKIDGVAPRFNAAADDCIEQS